MSASQDETFFPPRRPARNSASLDGDTVLPASNLSGLHILGDVIDNRYKVVREIGRGGMGIVYEVEDTLLGGRVAIKRLLPELVTRKELVDVFKREGANAMRFTSESPRFVTMRHVGTDLGGLYLVMDYIADPTLRTILNSTAKSRLSLPDAIVVMNELVSAIGDLHRFGYIHRDLKPENIFVYSAGKETRVRLVDFGLTKDDTESTRTSMRGAGTSGYTSPEQRKGLPSKPTTDIYAFGVIAYEMLCGELPTVGDEITDFVSTVPKPLCDLIMLCLSSRVERRPANGEALHKLLAESLLHNSSTPKVQVANPSNTLNRSTVRLQNVPHGASTYLDSRKVDGTSHQISFRGDSYKVSVSVSFAGHDDFTDVVNIFPDMESVVDVVLRRKIDEDRTGAGSTTSGTKTNTVRPPSKHSLGIDLGTTKCVVSIFDGKNAVVIPNAEGELVTPSVVAFQNSGAILVGTPAKRQAILNPARTLFSSKRDIGTDQVTRIDGVQYTPVDISALLLSKLKIDAEAYTGSSFSTAVVTVPAYFNDAQRIATKTATEQAGLEVLRIINEPTAAALAYGIQNRGAETVLVYDFGGGTFDVTILDINDGSFTVRATSGDTYLGGDDFDQVIVDFLLEAFRKSEGVDLSSNLQAMQRLREAAIQAKVELSSTESTQINIPFLHTDSRGPAHLVINLSRAQFESMTCTLIDQTIDIVHAALGDAGLPTSAISDVLLVGGSSRIPAVKNRIREIFCKEPNQRVNAIEAVALGAAIQAGMLRGLATDLSLSDVTSMSMGIATVGGVMTRLIDRNSPIPIRRTEEFSTAADGQTSVNVEVYQGESDVVADNWLIGDFELNGIMPAPKGVPRIVVSFDIDANGILSVEATDGGTGKKIGITIDKHIRAFNS